MLEPLTMVATTCWKNLCELPFRPNEQRVVTKGYLNLQNRNDLLLVEDITADEWMDIQFELQPTIYKLKEGDNSSLSSLYY